MTFESWVGKVAIRSERTAYEYLLTVKRWAKSRGFDDADLTVEDIKARGLDPYELLQEYVTALHNRGLAPSYPHT